MDILALPSLFLSAYSETRKKVAGSEEEITNKKQLEGRAEMRELFHLIREATVVPVKLFSSYIIKNYKLKYQFPAIASMTLIHSFIFAIIH